MVRHEEIMQPVEISYNENDISVSSFISYLIAAFDCRGIKLFQGFKILLVIFSENYASSVSCLENLVKYLELSYPHEDRYEVVPVFYSVSRAAVQQQLEAFGDAFKMLSVSYPADQVSKWRFALAETAKLQGHEYNDESSEESEFVEEIAEAVFGKLYPTEEVGIQSRQLDIENLLCEQPWGLRTLGILGEPHIGKTVLARAVFRRMVGCYDASRFIEDFHTEYREMRVDSLHGDFLCGTPTEVFDLNDSDLEPCERKKRVLLVIDDVRNAQDAKSFLGTSVDQFGPGSLVIITSRTRTVLEDCEMNEIYELKGLNDEDALKLFTRCAFSYGAIDENLLDLSMSVIKNSSGNPHALRSHAEKLKGKTMVETEPALRHDEACIDTKVVPPLCFINYETENDRGLLDTNNTKSIFQKKFIWPATKRFTTDLESSPDEFHQHSNFPETWPSDLRVSHIDHDPAVHFWSQYFQRMKIVMFRLTCPIHQVWGGYSESFSSLTKINLGNLEALVELKEVSEVRGVEQNNPENCKSSVSIQVTDQRERLRALFGSSGINLFPRLVWTVRETNTEAESTGTREIKSETKQCSKLLNKKSTTTLE